ncbi:MAG: hypothetical protein JWM36_3224 [Hyphomicrobiales bacterium]|nr:hypothetical protein [Hyphomicrobiales bacterium]
MTKVIERRTHGNGKWHEPGVPHDGWKCVGFVDLGEEQITCEMCDRQSVRYAHTMGHPDHPVTLTCGSKCAGRMEGEPAHAKWRERFSRNAAARRARWDSRHVSAKR